MSKTTADVTAPGTPDVKVDPETGKLALHWPVLVVEGLATGEGGKGNGRFIPLGSLGHRALPLPVAGQVINDAGHKGAEVFGRITRLVRHEGPDVVSKETGQPFPEGTAVWEAWGEGDATSKPGKLALEGYLTGNSADLAEVAVEETLAEDGAKATVSLRGGKIAGTTLVPIPAFADGYVEVNGQRRDPAQTAVEPLVAAAWTIVDTPTDPAPITAAADAFRPPLALFQPKKYTAPTPLSVTVVDGYQHVSGHIADWNRSHISFLTGQERKPPRNHTSYALFNTGAVRAMDGDTERTVAVGRLTHGGGHADLSLDAAAAARHYDDAGTAWAWVQASDDEHGIQVNGVVRPGISDDVVVNALAHPQSGDWRPVDGRLELVASVGVNTAGFPVPRALVASGEVVALVAAGAIRPAADSPAVVLEQMRTVVAEAFAGVREWLDTRLPGASVPTEEELADQHQQRLHELARLDLLEALDLSPADLGAVDDGRPSSVWDAGVLMLSASLSAAQVRAGAPEELTAWLEWSTWDEDSLELYREGLSGELANWVSKAGGLPSYVKRIVKHLQAKGMGESQAIATAVNAAKKMCTTGDTNLPGRQDVNAGSRAEACAAVADWNRKRAAG